MFDATNQIPWIGWSKMGISKAMSRLGVRDTRDFNLVLLAKLCWRLLQDPSSLMSELFKYKYHPHANFIHAKLSSRPSYVWMSL